MTRVMREKYQREINKLLGFQIIHKLNKYKIH